MDRVWSHLTYDKKTSVSAPIKVPGLALSGISHSSRSALHLHLDTSSAIQRAVNHRQDQILNSPSTASCHLSEMPESHLLPARNPLDFVLQMACADLHCYGESFQPDGDLLAFRNAYTPETIALTEDMKSFSSTAGSERYPTDVGVVGTASSASSYLVRDLRSLLDDQYFFSAGGSRLAMSVGLYHTVITIPLRKIPWSADVEGLPWHKMQVGSLLPYRQVPLVGVVVLYLTKPPKLLTELQRYLDCVMRCASPLIELSAERTLYERRVRRGGNKYRRLRRALLSTIRAKKKSQSVALAKTPALRALERSCSFGRDDDAEGDDLEAGTFSTDLAEPVTEDEVEDTKAVPHAASNVRGMELSSNNSFIDGDIASMKSVRGRGILAMRDASTRAAVLKTLQAYLRKWRGGDANMPARNSIQSSLIAAAPCFLTVACWQVMADSASRNFNYHGITDPLPLPGTFGALCTIVFALPTVPLAQPRNIVLAHTVSMTVVTVLLFIFEQNRHVWLQKALVVAVSVAGMAKFGILNPPAGAVGLGMITYANSAAYSIHGWLFLIVSTYLGCAVCIFVGVMWHNLYAGRVYPLFW